MRIRRRLDFYYSKGFDDAREGAPEDPFRVREDRDDRYVRMAYQAGYTKGLKLR